MSEGVEGKESSCRKDLSLQNQHQDQDQVQDHGPAQSTMSDSIKRRSSSRQLLQNLIRVTAQRSQEDAEEVERERRRRARDRQREDGSPSGPEPPQQSNLTHNTESGEELKPDTCLVLEEDEGFSDWSHRLENRSEPEAQDDCRVKEQRPLALPDPKEMEEGKQPQNEEDDRRELQQCFQSEEASVHPPEKTSVRKNAVRTSYSSSVFLSQDTRLQHAAGQPPDRTSYLAAGTMKPRGGACRVDGDVDQEKQKDEEEEEEEEEDVQPVLVREEESAETLHSAVEDEDLNCTYEERRDLHIQKKKSLSVTADEELMMQNQRSEDSRNPRSEVVSSRSAGSFCIGSEGEESLNCYGPMSPTFKKLLIQFYPDEVNSRVSPDGKCTITERTESLRRSVSNIKKTVPPVPVSKIDKKLEQYTHALEVSSKEGKSVSQGLTDLSSPSEPVASKKSLFEEGEAWNQNVISVMSSKDADGLKVGVADLINQWVRGSDDGSRCSSSSKPAEIKPGGVLNKKNLWESLGDTLPSARDGKESSTKRCKFVVMGHGKYEKVSADNSCFEADGQLYEDL